jgi:type IV pilus assembly protein PilM
MAGFIKNLFGGGGNKGGSVLGVDIGSSSIKVVQLARKGGKAVLETYGELALGPYAGIEIGRATNLAPEKISQALIDVIRESKVTAKQCALSIPFGSSLISAIEMPAVSEKQLAQMVPLEARKYIPVPINEVALDWWIIPKSPTKAVEFGDKQTQPVQGDKVDVLLVALHKDVLQRFQTIVTQASLDASFFEIEIFSTIRSVLDPEIENQMIIDMGAASTKVYIVEAGIIRVSHIINRGAQDITLALSKALNVSVKDAEIMKRNPAEGNPGAQKDFSEIIALTLDFVFSEAGHVLLSYQKRYNKDVKKISIVGGGARLARVLQLAESHLQNTIVLGDPFSKTEAPVFLADVLKKTGPEFAVAVGVALRKLQEND